MSTNLRCYRAVATSTTNSSSLHSGAIYTSMWLTCFKLVIKLSEYHIGATSMFAC